MENLHSTSVDFFVARGEYAVQQDGCPLETWARDLRTYVDDQTTTLQSLYQLPAGEARGMALAGLISGRPGSWESAEIITMARADFTPLVRLTTDRAAVDLLGQWHTWQVDGGQVVDDALARLTELGPIVPYGSYFAATSFAISTTA